MPNNSRSNRIRKFILENIDSVELVEVLSLLRSSRDNWMTSSSLTKELRSNQTSVELRLSRLVKLGLAETHPTSSISFRLRFDDRQKMLIVDEFLQMYQDRPHEVLELIFSPASRRTKIDDE